jgi:hypothetical protein
MEPTIYVSFGLNEVKPFHSAMIDCRKYFFFTAVAVSSYFTLPEYSVNAVGSSRTGNQLCNTAAAAAASAVDSNELFARTTDACATSVKLFYL